MTRWRARHGENYFYVTEDLKANYSIDYHCTGNDSHFNSFNYFKTKKEAEEVAAKFRSILKQHHKDQEVCTQ